MPAIVPAKDRAATEAPAAGAVRRPRVCMFVYNNFAADARVTKEAHTLIESGYDVEVVAVLDKKTVPEEVRDGISIVRIDRRPLHYRLLWRSRRIRRWLRLRNARVKRRLRLIRNTMRRRWRALRRGRPTAGRQPGRGAPVSATEAGTSTLLAFPTRVYRAIRWRLLLRSETLRRAYYRRRAGRAVLLHGWRYRRRARARITGPARAARRPSRVRRAYRRITGEAGLAGVPAPLRLLLLPLAVPFLILRALAAGIRRLPDSGRRLDRTVSHAAYRAVMFFHRPLMFLDFYMRAYRYARDRDIDVFHAHDLNTLPVAALAARRRKAHLVYDSHELYTEVSTLSRVERRVWQTVERALIGRADSIVTVCESIAGELEDRYRVARPLILLNCPTASAIQHERPTRNVLRERAGLLDSPEPIVLYQGGFAVHRGLPELIDAAKHFTRGVLVLMGWGNLEDELAAKIAADGLEGRVVVIGPATPAELPMFTAGADLGVIPYQAVGLNNYYTTPNKLFEYIASGIAVAGSRFPELRRVIDAYEIGVTFDPNDPQDIALAVNHVLEDPPSLHRMRANTARAARELTWENQVGKLVSLYGELVPAGGRDRLAA